MQKAGRVVEQGDAESNGMEMQKAGRVVEQGDAENRKVVEQGDGIKVAVLLLRKEPPQVFLGDKRLVLDMQVLF